MPTAWSVCAVLLTITTELRAGRSLVTETGTPRSAKRTEGRLLRAQGRNAISSTIPEVMELIHPKAGIQALHSLSSPTAPIATSSEAAPTEAQSIAALWAQFPTGSDEETAVVQAVIYGSQNPENCSAARFMVWRLNSYGIGSDIHTTGWALGHAMALERVLIYKHDNHWVYTTPEECPDRETMDCFFLPLSRCQDAVTKEESQNARSYQPSAPDKRILRDRVLYLPFHDADVGFIPAINDWAQKGISWWRSQTTKYIARPTPEMLAWTARMFSTNLIKHSSLQDPDWNTSFSPPPESAICIHIRHGDKASEMKLHPLIDYLDPAWGLVKEQGAPSNIFISTDDEHVIAEIQQGQHQAQFNFTYYFFRYLRRNDLSPMATGAALGRVYFARVSIANLILGVHPSCKYFVQTTGSNWNRLINEIRKTDGIRAGAPWVDIQGGEWRSF